MCPCPLYLPSLHTPPQCQAHRRNLTDWLRYLHRQPLLLLLHCMPTWMPPCRPIRRTTTPSTLHHHPLQCLLPVARVDRHVIGRMPTVVAAAFARIARYHL